MRGGGDPKILYRGIVNNSVYDLAPFSELITHLGGDPLPEVYRGGPREERHCAWRFQDSDVIVELRRFHGLKYFKELKVTVEILGTDYVKRIDLEGKIKTAAAERLKTVERFG